ncbi:MAG: HlyD family efflux transporter periplasmic adaptor subunit [Calditrichaeota bacterium]|nr:MAG: HlyD family efflux transporter periplasmic adaptor subunit [Calditrichota bacterium]
MHAKRLKKHNASLVQSAKEHKKNSPIPWGKIIYLGIFIFLLFKAASWAYRNSLYIEATGYIFSNESFVETQVPGTIVKINCSVNDLVRRGDPLIYLAGYGFESQAENGFFSIGSHSVIRRRLVEAENEHKILNKEISLVEGELRDNRNEKQRALKLLNASAISLSRFNGVSKKVEETSHRLILLRTKSLAAQRLVNTLKSELGKVAGNGGGFHYNFTNPEAAADWPADRILRAPIDGKITAVSQKLGEVAQPGELVVKIAEMDDFFIKAFFKVSSEGAFDVGDQVRIRYENGDRSLGLVQKIYVAADATPHVFRGQFAAPQNMIVAEIKPLDDAPNDHILAMKVKVYVKRSLF